MTDMNSLMRQLPKVDDVIRTILTGGDCHAPVILIKPIIQKEIELVRQRILSGEITSFSRDSLIKHMKAEIKKHAQPHLRKVINATGIILHTNLGRAKLSKYVTESLMEISGSYSNLEYDLENGERGSRYSHVEELLKLLTGAEAALVVNNNAAAVYLILDTMVKGKEVIVSRGELVEIGGSFRVPEIMKASGCRLVEVGATNKTHQSDYEEHISDDTGALLKVHTSNYKIIGFTDEVSLTELKKIGSLHQLPVICDLGSGLLTDLQCHGRSCHGNLHHGNLYHGNLYHGNLYHGIADEPTVKGCLAQKADIVCFSGDKLLGGPQAGIIVGSAEYIEKMKKNHLLRALRIDKLTLTALELTLRQYLTPEEVCKQIPTLNMITESEECVKERADILYGMLRKDSHIQYNIVQTEAQIGGGSMPGVGVPSYALSIRINGVSADTLERCLRENEVPIIGRILKENVLLDVRTMEYEDLEIAAAFLNEYKLD